MNVTATRYGHRRFGGSKSASELPISISETTVEASNHCSVPTKSLMQAFDASRSFLISPRYRAYDQDGRLNGKSTVIQAVVETVLAVLNKRPVFQRFDFTFADSGFVSFSYPAFGGTQSSSVTHN